MSFWTTWRRQGHWSLAFAVVFFTVFAWMSRNPWWLCFIGLVLASDGWRGYGKWLADRARRQQILDKYEPPRPWRPR